MATDLPSVLDILGALGVHGTSAATPIAGGGDTSIWRIEWHDEAFALRLFPVGQDAVCAREVAVMVWAQRMRSQCRVCCQLGPGKATQRNCSPGALA
jgi:hypothetical protein